MTLPRLGPDESIDSDTDLPEDLLESIEDTDDDDYGDETQADEESAAEAGIEQEDLIDPRGEDEREDDADD